MQLISDRIKQALKESKLAQGDIAELIGTSTANVQIQLSGKNRKRKDCDSIRIVLACHQLTGASLDWLIKGDGEGMSDLQDRIKSVEDNYSEEQNELSRTQEQLRTMTGLVKSLQKLVDKLASD